MLFAIKNVILNSRINLSGNKKEDNPDDDWDNEALGYINAKRKALHYGETIQPHSKILS